MNSSPFSPQTAVGDIVAAQPLLAGFFERLGVDYCCGGKQSLAAVCAARRLDVATVVALLDIVALPSAARPVVDAARMALPELADHIEATHHAYVRAELPALVEKAEHVARKHGGRDPRLATVAEITRLLAEEMFQHMAKEEQVLFPLIRELARHGCVAHACGSIANPIRQMEYEHTGAGDAVASLRELTDGFAPDTDACNTHRALLAGLARFEVDLHEHVHKENNVLFPRALALETGAGT